MFVDDLNGGLLGGSSDVELGVFLEGGGRISGGGNEKEGRYPSHFLAQRYKRY